MRRQNNFTRQWLALAAGVSVLVIAMVMSVVSCTSLRSSPRQGWNQSYGPVVPHDKFPGDCSICHVGRTWTVIKTDFKFDHAKQTGVPLNGAHARTTCLMCHNDRGKAGMFAAQGCGGCHTDPHRSQMGRMCAGCHTEENWKPRQSYAQHNRTRFPLVGAHATAACFSCHPGAQVGNFKGADTQCATCHTKDIARAKSPDHVAQGWTSDCQRCHQPAAFKPASFQHPSSFPLTLGHSGKNCTDCHKNGVYTGLSTDCVSCHLKNYQNTTTPNHTAAGFATACKNCHNTAGWTGANFKHTAAFPLTNGHANRACTDCHTNGTYVGLSKDCVSCHLPKYQATTNPNHAQMGFDTNCASCHNTTQWQGAKFNHPASFPLTNAHANRSCTDCHKNGTYKGLSTSCVSCHQGSFTASTNPNHTKAGFDTTCNTCHNTTAWKPATYTHVATFPLSNGHAGKQCTDCHASGVYKGLPKDCVSCHLAKYQATTNPNHAATGYGTTCADCHSTKTWLDAKFNHPASFPLTNAHSNRLCSDCHKNGAYTGLSTSCASCHQGSYDASTNPNHKNAAFATTCNTCHGTTAWKPATYTHVASFPLTNGHAGKQCTDCHASGVYKGLPKDCASCHLAKYNATTNPNHKTIGYGTDCATCHKSTIKWTGAIFTHKSTFPLTNAHANRLCNDCHKNGVYTGLSTTCSACHQGSYTASTNPNHAKAAFSTTCNTCHNTSAWKPATYTHVATFPLSNGHANRQCTDCHASGVYRGLPKDCVSCHLGKYNATTNPNHKTIGYSTDCAVCHKSTAQWTGATFTHKSTFPLTNAHANKLCSDCHKNGVYTGLSTACATCHQSKYDASTNPNHKNAAFSTTCNTCHSTTAWTPATYSHVTTFPLTNKHSGLKCTDCHASGVYKGLPKDCASCHLGAYNATTSPNHKSTGFGTDCATCHKTTGWTGASFNHTWFPITSGNHKLACAKCHTTANNYVAFSCLTGCHAKTTTDSHHRGVGGYSYVSARCYSCHPRGRAD